jgi:hypothetical protein
MFGGEGDNLSADELKEADKMLASLFGGMGGMGGPPGA